MKRSTAITIAIGIAFVICNEIAWLKWQSGKIMARSRSSQGSTYSEIIVREMPMTKANAYMYFRHYLVSYKIQLLGPDGKERPMRDNTYYAGNFKASRAKIDWTDDHNATIYLDDTPVMKTADSLWTRLK
jgi:hypothetical protein